MNKKMMILGLAVVLLASIAIGCIHGEEKTLDVAGSTTVAPLGEEWARLFMEKNPDVKVYVASTGSGAGIKAAGGGEVDIGMSSRDVKPEEFETYPGIAPVVVAKDAMAIVVHPNNPVNDLTTGQIAKIFAGEITNWNEVGGTDATITVVTREVGSGTRGVFEEIVMKDDTPIYGGALVQESTGKIRAYVAGDVLSIGYISLGRVDETVKALRVAGVECTVENVAAGRYPIARSLYLITMGEPDELERGFLDFVLSPEGQKVVDELDYIPMT